MENHLHITVLEGITLVTFENIKYDLDFISDMFSNIGNMGIDVDMISIMPTQRSLTSVSFTIKDEDLKGILEYTARLKKCADIRSNICSGNYKISIFDRSMQECPGFAAKIFKAIASINSEFLIVTTSEVEISVLVDDINEDELINVIKKSI